MKTFVSLALVSFLAAAALAQAPLANPVDKYGRPLNGSPFYPAPTLLDNLDFNGKKASQIAGMAFTPGAVSRIAADKEIYIAFRTDAPVAVTGVCGNQGGSGLPLDPCDGSTRAKFDAIMLALPNAPLNIHFSAGTFETYGCLTPWYLKAGWRLFGAGMYATTIKQVYLPTDNLNFPVLYGDVDNVEVHDLTIDCNYTVLAAALGTHTNANIGAVQGRSGLLQNVRAIHAGGDLETFVISLNAQGPVGANAAARELVAPKKSEIIGCRVEQTDPTKGINTTAITINAGYFESLTIPMEDILPYGRSAIIRDCYVDGGAYTTTQANKVGLAYQMGGFHSGLVQGNYARNAGHGFFQDTCPTRNLQIVDNTFDGVGIGIDFNGGGRNVTSGGLIARNNLVIYGGGIALNSANNMLVEANLIRPVTGASVSAAIIFQNKNADYPTVDNSQNIYRKNRISDEFSEAEVRAADGATGAPVLEGNRYLDGSEIDEIPDAVRYALPASLADMDNGSAAPVISDAATATFGLDSGTDVDDIVNGTTDRITAPASGRMLIHFHALLSSVTSSGYIQLRVSKNGSTTGMRYVRYSSPIAANTYNLETSVACAANDYFQILIENQTGASMTLSSDGLASYATVEFIPTP